MTHPAFVDPLFAFCRKALLSMGLLSMELGLGLTLCAWPVQSAPTPVPVVSTTKAIKTQSISFASLGRGAIELRGVQGSGYVQFGSRGDQVITAAKLRLRMTYSPSLLAELSHLRVVLNDQIITALPLTKESAGREIERDIDLDPRYFTDYNQFRLDLISHYTLGCEDPTHSTLWLNISPRSELIITLQPLVLRNDMALLPVPFFDRRDNQRLVLPMVLPDDPGKSLVHAAGMAASWFGMLADYRSARFPVFSQQLPDHHALVFANNNLAASLLQLPAVKSPTIRMVDNPNDANLKLLVFQGTDDAQVEQAVRALVLGNPAFSGSEVTVTAVNSKPRPAYDAPRWLRGDRAVTFGELVDSAQQLQANGISAGPININLRLPPDLFTWNSAGVPMDLRYRHTAALKKDNSLLNVSINNQLLRSYRLSADSGTSLANTLRVPLLNANGAEHDSLTIPALQLTSNNQLQFQFALSYHHDGPCSEIFNDVSRAAIDAESTIDISGFEHYTALPNLALFANAGYPFTRYADLSQTGVVLSDRSPASLEQLFFILGRMGRHTGAVADHYQLLDTTEAKHATNLDLLVLSGAANNRLLGSWNKDLSLRIEQSERDYRSRWLAPLYAGNTLRPMSNDTQDQVTFNSNGQLAAFLSFQSPLSDARTVVALSGSDATAAGWLINALEDDGKMAQVRGDVSIVRGELIQSYQGESLYFVGSLSWWRWLWFHLSRHPIVLTLIAIATAITAALLIYGWLQQRHRQRMAKSKSGHL